MSGRRHQPKRRQPPTGKRRPRLRVVYDDRPAEPLWPDTNWWPLAAAVGASATLWAALMWHLFS